jgi:hypothetical protein
MIDEAKFNRFSIALNDFEKVIAFLDEAKRHPITSIVYESLIFAAIVCYCRPFSLNETSKDAPAACRLNLEDFPPLSSPELAAHEKCKELRNKALAHAEFNYRPIHLDHTTGGISSALFSFIGNSPDLEKLAELTHKLIRVCKNRRADFVWKASIPPQL